MEAFFLCLGCTSIIIMGYYTAALYYHQGKWGKGYMGILNSACNL